MSGKAVIRLDAARCDERNAIEYYSRTAGLDVALRLTEELRDVYRSIGERPCSGSPRFAQILGIAQLRSRRLRRFPYFVFYIERETQIDIWHVLHTQRDIGRSLQD